MLVFIRGSRGELADHKPGMMTLISLPGIDSQLVGPRMLHFRKLPHHRRVLAELLHGPQYDFMLQLA